MIFVEHANDFVQKLPTKTTLEKPVGGDRRRNVSPTPPIEFNAKLAGVTRPPSCSAGAGLVQTPVSLSVFDGE